MMSRRFITLLLLSGAFLQTLLPVWDAFGALELPIMTALVICFALHTNRSGMLYGAVLAGLLHDAFCLAPMGLSIPFFAALAAGVNWIRDEVFGDQPATYAVLGALAAVAGTFYYTLVFKLSGMRPVSGSLLALRLAGGLISGAVVVPLAAMVVLHLHSLTARNRRRFV